MSRVSVIVPIYNVESRLSMCIDSLRNQTFSDIEIILINDGSTDNSSTICAKYEKMDDRIFFFSIPNSGVSIARNEGIKHANSDYILFVDSDDTVDKTLVEILYEQVNNKDIDFAMSGYRKKIYKNENDFETICIEPSKFSGEIVKFLDVIDDYVEKPLLQGPCWKIFKKKIIEDEKLIFPENMSFGEDAAFVYKYLQYVNNVSVISEALYSYNVFNNESLSRKFRIDKYKINLYLISLLSNLYTVHGLKADQMFISKQIVKSYTSYLGTMWSIENGTQKSIRKNIIIHATHKKETKIAFEFQKNESFQTNLLNRLVSKDYFSLIDYYFCIKEITKNKVSLLYRVLIKYIK